MDVKRVWGIIIIVFSLLLVLGCANHYYELATLDTFVQASKADYGKIGKTWFSTSALGKTYSVAVRNEKLLSIVGFVLGACLAVIGTLMLEETSPKHCRFTVHIDDSSPDDLDGGISGTQRFKL
jgi:hypothetical protein